MTTAQGTLDLCRLLGVRLVSNGAGGFKAYGTSEAKAKVKELVLEHREEILRLLAAKDDDSCDDCGKPAPVLIVTDYGCRYCRACLRPESISTKPKMKGLS